MRNQLKRILENSTLPIEELALDVFRESIHELGNVKHSRVLTKLDKAQILTNSIDENQLEVLYRRMSAIHETGIFHGKFYDLKGFTRVSRKRSLKAAVNPKSLYLKIDIVSSTALLENLGEAFETHVIKILDFCKICFTEQSGTLITQEGDALYFSFNNGEAAAAIDMFNTTLTFIKWLEEYNLFHNDLGQSISFKFVGLSIPTHKDDDDNHTITDRLTEFEKKFGRADSLILDEYIWKNIPVNIHNLVRKFYISDGMFYGMYKAFSFQNSFEHSEILCD